MEFSPRRGDFEPQEGELRATGKGVLSHRKGDFEPQEGGF